MLNQNNNRGYKCYTSIRALYAERLNPTIRDLLRKPVFERRDANWVNISPTIRKQSIIIIHSSTKLTPIEASLKNNEGNVYQSLLEGRKKIEPMFEIHDLARTADLKRTSSKKDSTNWSYILYKNIEVLKNAIPNYRLDSLPERYSEALLKKTQLTIKEKDSVLEILIKIT